MPIVMCETKTAVVWQAQSAVKFVQREVVTAATVSSSADSSTAAAVVTAASSLLPPNIFSEPLQVNDYVLSLSHVVAL